MAALGRLARTLPGPEERGPATVRDIDGNAMELDAQPIGRGGQGTVYRIRQTRYAVKLSDEPRLVGPGDGLAERLARLRWLPLEGLPVSRPLRSLAEPHVGYTMDLLDDMEPMAALCEPPDGEMEPWYLAGGGLRRRLRLLARCAGILGIMHGRGLVYGDVSPGNVLISADPRHCRVWLIDPDNIAIESSARQRVVQTRLYRAPEIVRKQSGNTPFSDIYSFAILAYQTLRGDHPLLGDLVDESPHHEEEVERGLLPWAGHSTDARNRSSYGVAAETVLSTRLADLFRQNFETGLNDPVQRPPADAWAAALAAAADVTLTCRASGCGHSFYAFGPHCPFCHAARPDALVVGVWEQVPGQSGVRGPRPLILPEARWIVLQADEPFLVTERHARLVAHDPDQPVLRLSWRGGGTVDIENVGSVPVRRVPPTGGTGRTLLPGALAAERIEARWQVHFDDDRRVHRLLTFHEPEQGA